MSRSPTRRRGLLQVRNPDQPVGQGFLTAPPFPTEPVTSVGAVLGTVGAEQPHALNARSFPSRDNHRCPQTSPWGQSHPWMTAPEASLSSQNRDDLISTYRETDSGGSRIKGIQDVSGTEARAVTKNETSGPPLLPRPPTLPGPQWSLQEKTGRERTM